MLFQEVFHDHCLCLRTVDLHEVDKLDKLQQIRGKLCFSDSGSILIGHPVVHPDPRSQTRHDPLCVIDHPVIFAVDGANQQEVVDTCVEDSLHIDQLLLKSVTLKESKTINDVMMEDVGEERQQWEPAQLESLKQKLRKQVCFLNISCAQRYQTSAVVTSVKCYASPKGL